MDRSGNKEVLYNEFVLGTAILFPDMTVGYLSKPAGSWFSDFKCFMLLGKAY